MTQVSEDPARQLSHINVNFTGDNDAHDSEQSPSSWVTFSDPSEQDNNSLCENHNGQISNGEIIQNTVHQTVENDERVITGFKEIVRDRRKLASQKKTIFRGVLYAFILTAVGVGIYILDYYVPTPYLALAMPLGVALGLAGAMVWFSYRRCGRARWALNWRLKKTSRYLDACQVSDDYIKNMLPQIAPEYQGVCHCRLAGSSADGYGFFPSLSANVGICHKQPPLTQDVDMNIFYDALQLGKEDLFSEGLPPGFCWIRLDSRSDNLDAFIRDCVVEHPTLPGSYLSGELVSEKIGKFIPNTAMYNYPAITYTNILDGPQGKYTFDVDIVFGIKISAWPDAASEWQNMENRHLPREIVEDIVRRGCYIVHKHCTKAEDLFPLGHQEHNMDWRLTFAEAESELFRFHSEKEALKLCYVIIKFVIKLYSRNRKQTFHALKSYHLKTLFLRIAENESENFNMKEIKNNDDLGPLFMFVLSEYKKALQHKSLPQYFMPSVNILEQYTEEEIKQGINIIDEFERKPLSVIDAFDKSWINRKNLDLFFIVAFIAIFFCFGMKFYFEYRSETLLKESRLDLLEAFAGLSRDLNLTAEFYKCVKEKNALGLGGSQRTNDVESVTDTVLATTTELDLSNILENMKMCRIQLGLA